MECLMVKSKPEIDELNTPIFGNVINGYSKSISSIMTFTDEGTSLLISVKKGDKISIKCGNNYATYYLILSEYPLLLNPVKFASGESRKTVSKKQTMTRILNNDDMKYLLINLTYFQKNKPVTLYVPETVTINDQIVYFNY